MKTDDYQIRTMSRGDLDRAIAWATAEGWNPGLHDADAFYQTDPNGFLMGCLHGEPILDVPEPNAPAVALAERYGMTPMFETARMYAPQVPDLPVDRIFGVTTFELG